MGKKEYLLCAAIWIDTGEASPPRRTYSYPKTGLLFCGWRHADCMVARDAWLKASAALAGMHVDDLRHSLPEEQGFLTSTGRFVDRLEATQIAFAAGQSVRHSGGLSSEDLY